MEKRLILLLCIILAAVFTPRLTAQTNLRQSVCVVRPDNDSTTVSNLMSPIPYGSRATASVRLRAA